MSSVEPTWGVRGQRQMHVGQEAAEDSWGSLIPEVEPCRPLHHSYLFGSFPIASGDGSSLGLCLGTVHLSMQWHWKMVTRLLASNPDATPALQAAVT